MTLIVTLATTAKAQYNIALVPQKATEGKYYLGQHFRDKFEVVDSANAGARGIVFAGKSKLAAGVYTLLDANKKKVFDFMVDDSRRFSISYDSVHSNKGMVVTGSKANQLMFAYMTRQDEARNKAKMLGEQKKDPNMRAKAEKEMDELSEEMTRYEKEFFKANSKYRFPQLVRMFSNISVPDSMPKGVGDVSLHDWQACYYRTHYWDSVDFSDHSIVYTPHLFDKMNYYFFGVLYYQDCDTITKYANMVLNRVQHDSTMLRYFLDFITPRYERSTKMIGWDQVFVNLCKDWYLKGRCPWASEAEVWNKKQTVEFLSHSLIGAPGAELLMADTNQSPDIKDWKSSHRFPQRFVMLWFWDPDCHHCQKQTAELKVIYDSMVASGKKYFEVYAVGYEADVNKWKKYVREHELPFVNVGGSNVNIDYQEAYNVHGAPTMILLDERRRIIMNKTLPMDQVIPFLQRWEKDHPISIPERNN